MQEVIVCALLKTVAVRILMRVGGLPYDSAREVWGRGRKSVKLTDLRHTSLKIQDFAEPKLIAPFN